MGRERKGSILWEDGGKEGEYTVGGWRKGRGVGEGTAIGGRLFKRARMRLGRTSYQYASMIYHAKMPACHHVITLSSHNAIMPS